MPFTIPSAGKVAGVSTGLTTDLNNLYPAVGSIAGVNVLNTAYAGGADPAGVADSAAAFAAAVTALGGSGGVVYVPPGTYKLSSGVTLGVGQYITGAGINATILNFTGTGDCIRQTFAGPYSGITTVGGGVTSLTIDGTSAGAGSSGIHAGDIESLNFDRTFIRNFSGAGSIGYHFDNAVDQTERLQGSIRTVNCTSGVVFDVSGATTSTGSFARPNLVIFITASTVTQNGVVLQNGARIYDIVRFDISGNFGSASAGSPGAVLTITGSVPAGHPDAGQTAQITNGPLNVGVENATGAVTTQTINFGGGAAGIINCYGHMDWGVQGAGTFTASNNSSQFRYTGTVVGDSTLVSSRFDGIFAIAGFATGGTISSIQGRVQSVNPAAPATGVIISAGQRNGQDLKVVNLSANTVTFAVAGTSNVAAGASATVPATGNRDFVWNAGTNQWVGGV